MKRVKKTAISGLINDGNLIKIEHFEQQQINSEKCQPFMKIQIFPFLGWQDC